MSHAIFNDGLGRCVGVIQARTSSSRFPGKVLADLFGRPMILFMVDRVRRARRLDAVIVATSTEPSDDDLARVLATGGVNCLRGSLNDVLGRFAMVAAQTGADRVVRMTGDCPLIDPDLIDRVISRLDTGAEYAANIDPPTFPDGLDVEAFTREVLDRAVRAATLGSDREHVTPWLRRDENGIAKAMVTSPIDLSALRWTVDYPDDLEAVRRLTNNMSVAQAVAADRFDFLRVLDHAGGMVPAPHARNEGYDKSRADD